jgi:hypothetical protein
MSQMEHAEQRGDRHSARALARTILAAVGSRAEPRASTGERPLGSMAAEQGAEQGVDAEQALRSARELLARTEPDPFLFVVGIAGLGLLVWLVYSYVL